MNEPAAVRRDAESDGRKTGGASASLRAWGCGVTLFLGLTILLNLFTLAVTLDARSDIARQARGLADTVEDISNDSIQLDIPVDQDVEIQTTLPLDTEVTVPIDAEVFIDEQVVVPIGGLRLPIPLRVTVPVSTTVTVPIRAEVPIDTTVPLSITIPVEVPLEDTPFGDALVDLEEALRRIGRGP